ncbi:MAG: nitrite reductase, copper-containing, partial [Flavobacterium sp.]|nr:nitrite reductase, copper-containing [Flavobacterium sp.]
QSEGQGVVNVFPPLAKSDYLNKDVNRAIKTVLNGLSGTITVNGKTYKNIMTSLNLTDDEIADVLTYVYDNWNNNKTNVTTAMVKEQKTKKKE